MKEENKSSDSWLPGDAGKFWRQMEESAGSDDRFFFLFLTSSLLTVKFISSCETAISVLTVTVDLCMP